MQPTIVFNTDSPSPSGRLAEVELHFTEGLFAGYKLCGFAIWERRDGGFNVTFPARQYAINGECRSFALLRPIADASDTIKNAIVAAWIAYVGQQEVING